jgi:peroxiredoxin
MQLRQDYHEFQQRDAEIVAIGPDKPERIAEHWSSNAIPFPGLADPDKDVLKDLGQEFRLLKFGRMPSVMILDRHGNLAYVHRGNSANDIPENRELFEVLDQLSDGERDESADPEKR